VVRILICPDRTILELKMTKRIALDIETNMAHDVIHLCVTQDIDTGEVRVWKAQTGLWDYLKDATLIAAHNGISFDFPILNKLWKTKIGLRQAYDTLIVSRLLEPTRDGGHSLDAWGKTLGVAKLDYKATWQWMMNRQEEYSGEAFDNPIEGLLDFYCRRDASVLVSLFHRLDRDVTDKGFAHGSLVLEHSVAAILNKQEKNGFKLDTIHATCLLAELKGKMSAINDKMQELYPPYEVERISEKTGKILKPELVVFNPASPPHGV